MKESHLKSKSHVLWKTFLSHDVMTFKHINLSFSLSYLISCLCVLGITVYNTKGYHLSLIEDVVDDLLKVFHIVFPLWIHDTEGHT